MREEFLLRAARRALANAAPSDRGRFEQMIYELCRDPGLELPIKVKFDVPPVVISLYHDGTHWVVYDLPDDATVRIWMIGKVPDAPRPY